MSHKFNLVSDNTRRTLNDKTFLSRMNKIKNLIQQPEMAILSFFVSKKSRKHNNPTPAPPPVVVESVKVPPLFRRVDWLTALVTFTVIGVVYFLTMAPQVTLEDSGELVTGSF